MPSKYVISGVYESRAWYIANEIIATDDAVDRIIFTTPVPVGTKFISAFTRVPVKDIRANVLLLIFVQDGFGFGVRHMHRD